MLKVFDNTVIYIYCPPKVITGGPEALHQLRFYLEECGYCAKIIYSLNKQEPPPDRYKQYNPVIVSGKEIKDHYRNIVIVPETATYMLNIFKKSRKCVWWLSYDNYIQAKKEEENRKIRILLKKLITLIFPMERKKPRYPFDLSKVDYHFCASKYADLSIRSNLGIKNTEMLVEPISLDFLKIGKGSNLSSVFRTDCIPYNPNPLKISDIQKKLLKRTDLSFIPIQGMEPREIAELFRRSKLYVDFGSFPGPERLPKESVYNGTCLLVGKHNAAVNDFDVAIPEQYKVEDFNNEELVVEKIKDILSHYDEYIGDFSEFRDKIDKLETNFIKSIKEIFVKSER